MYSKMISFMCYTIYPAPGDYSSLSMQQLSLNGSNTRACTNITIEDDNISEDDEDFSVALTEDDPRVEVSRDEATVQISDNDGTYLH